MCGSHDNTTNHLIIICKSTDPSKFEIQKLSHSNLCNQIIRYGFDVLNFQEEIRTKINLLTTLSFKQNRISNEILGLFSTESVFLNK